MKKQIKEFWENKKDRIKNTIIVVTVPLLIVTIYNINRINKIAVKNDVYDLFYGKIEDLEDEA